jgi:hypothetical protein
VKSEPKVRPGSRAVPSSVVHESRGYLESVIGDLSDPDGGSMVYVRNKSPVG